MYDLARDLSVLVVHSIVHLDYMVICPTIVGPNCRMPMYDPSFVRFVIDFGFRALKHQIAGFHKDVLLWSYILVIVSREWSRPLGDHELDKSIARVKLVQSCCLLPVGYVILYNSSRELCRPSRFMQLGQHFIKFTQTLCEEARQRHIQWFGSQPDHRRQHMACSLSSTIQL